MASKSTERMAKAAELRAAQAKREARRRMLAIGGVVLAMVLIVGGGVGISLLKKSHDDQKVEKAVAQTTSGQYGVVIGPKSAQHHVVVYEDFLCPFCGELEKGSHEKLAELADKGDVQVDYRPFNLLGGNDANSYSVRAAGAFSVVLKKSGPVVAKRFHDLLFAHQPSESGPFPSDADLVDLAVQAGAPKAKVETPIENNAGLKWVEAATKAAFATGLNGTPTVLVDGRLLSSGTAQAVLDAVS